MNNLRQLGLAWHSYAQDSRDFLVPNNGDALPDTWVGGWLTTNANHADNTNLTLLLGGRLGPYMPAPRVFRCPGDRSVARFDERVLPRVRSVAMNGWVGSTSDRHHQALMSMGAADHRILMNLGDFLDPAPSGTWVLLDEREETIEDGWFGVAMHIEALRGSWPAGHHHRAGGFHFADGHSEIHRWLDPRTLPPVSPGASWEDNYFQPGSPDIRWLRQRTTGRK